VRSVVPVKSAVAAITLSAMARRYFLRSNPAIRAIRESTGITATVRIKPSIRSASRGVRCEKLKSSVSVSAETYSGRFSEKISLRIRTESSSPLK